MLVSTVRWDVSTSSAVVQHTVPHHFAEALCNSRQLPLHGLLQRAAALIAPQAMSAPVQPCTEDSTLCTLAIKSSDQEGKHVPFGKVSSQLERTCMVSCKHADSTLQRG